MSELPPLRFWEADEDEGGQPFKWGWNADTGEAEVWPVSGPGDGGPFHEEHLTGAWGRPPAPERGDVLGAARVEAVTTPAQKARIHVHAYYGEKVPASVLAAFAAALPDAVINVVR